MNIEFDDKTPIYLQIMSFIKREIVSKKLKGGDKLPSVREMSTTLRVNPNTLQRAYQELEREKVTYTQRGMGTFVTEDEGVIANMKIDMAKTTIGEFFEGMKNLGFSSNEIMEVVSQYIKKGDA